MTAGNINWLKLVFSILISHAAGFIGSFATIRSVDTWYSTLVRPELSPPNWVFGPVWLTLYTLMGIALYLVWQNGGPKKDLVIFYIHLVFNATWSIIFFGLNNVGLALANILVIWVFIVLLIFRFWQTSKTASWLLVPYLLWVSFATYLNYSILVLN